MSLKEQTITSAKWSVTAGLIQKALSFCTTIVLARILSPYEFGLYATAFIVIDGLGLFKSMGFDSALLQRKDDIDKAANTAFMVIPLLGIVMYAVLLLCLPVIGLVFHEEAALVGVLKVLGALFIVNCFARVPMTLLEKRMEFHKTAIIEVAGQIIFTLVALSLAFAGAKIWSLVIGYLSQTVVRLILAWIFAGWMPTLSFDRAIAKDMFHFGKFMFLESLVLFLQKNLDRLVIVKVLGIEAVGIYAIAYNLANIPNDYLGVRIKQVLFSAFVRLQDKTADLQRAYLRALKGTIAIGFPVGILIFFLGGKFLQLAFGEKWIAAIPVLGILAWNGIFNTVISGNRSVLLALKKSGLNFINVSLQIALYGILVVPAAKYYGLEGVAIVITLSTCAALLVTFIFVSRLTHVSLWSVWDSIKSVLTATILMIFGSIFTIKIYSQWFSGRWPIFDIIFLLICMGSMYLSSLYVFDKEIVTDFKKLSLS